MVFRARSIGLAVGVFMLSSLARAELGGDAGSVAGVERKFSAVRRQIQSGTHVVHQLALPDGPLVREYARPDGKVFAVSWSGSFRPDLRILLGAHYDAYRLATAGRRARGPRRIDVAGMTIVQAGTQRALFGKVILTGELPAGVAVEDVQ